MGLQPATDIGLVLGVLWSEFTLQVTLLAVDDAVLYEHEHNGKQNERPRRVDQKCYARVKQGHREIHGVAGEGKGSGGDDGAGRLVYIGALTGAGHGPLGPSNQHRCRRAAQIMIGKRPVALTTSGVAIGCGPEREFRAPLATKGVESGAPKGLGF